MPLFKYNKDGFSVFVPSLLGHIVEAPPYIDGGASTALPSFYGEMGASGCIECAVATTSGEFCQSIIGTIISYCQSVSGDIEVVTGITGAFESTSVTTIGYAGATARIVFPKSFLYGEMQADGLFCSPFVETSGYFAADGQMAMPLPHVAGSFADFVSGSIALACPVAAGLISVPVFVDGAISVPLLVFEGHRQAEGSLSVSIPAVEGYMQAEGTVAASIPSVCGIVTSPHFIFGETIIPVPQLGGDVRLVETIAGSVASFAPVTFGSINLYVPRAVTGRLVTPAPSIAGTLYAEQILNIGDDLIVNYQDDARYI